MLHHRELSGTFGGTRGVMVSARLNPILQGRGRSTLLDRGGRHAATHGCQSGPVAVGKRKMAGPALQRCDDGEGRANAVEPGSC